MFCFHKYLKRKVEIEYTLNRTYVLFKKLPNNNSEIKIQYYSYLNIMSEPFFYQLIENDRKPFNDKE